MMRFVLPALLLAASCAPAAVEAPPGPPVLTLAWTLEGLANPESVIPADDGTLYVSNVDGEGSARDGNGSIARVSRDGAMVERDWVTGLDAPKGLALRDSRLFVSDIDRLVEIDATTGAVLARYPAPDAQFLNDVTVLEDGTVLVSDSGGARIYQLVDGAMQLWLADERLASINGLEMEGGDLLVSTMEGLLLRVELDDKSITTLAENLGDADGIAVLGGGEYLVTEWPGRLFHVDAEGAAEVLLDTRASGVLLNDIYLLNDVLLIPNWEPGTLSAYQVSR